MKTLTLLDRQQYVYFRKSQKELNSTAESSLTKSYKKLRSQKLRIVIWLLIKEHSVIPFMGKYIHHLQEERVGIHEAEHF